MPEQVATPKKRTVNTTRGTSKIPTQEKVQDAIPRIKEVAPVSNSIPTGSDKCIIVVNGLTNRNDEVQIFRISGKAYTIKTNVPVEVPRHLAAHIMDLANRKKVAAQIMNKYRGDGISLGELG